MSEKKISNFRPFIYLNKISKKILLPGFEGIPLYKVTKFFFRGLWRGSLNLRASSLSFTFFLALFPTIIFFFTLIPYIPISGFQETLLVFLKGVLPKGAYSAVSETLEDIIKRHHGGLLSFGFLATLYLSTSGISGIMTAFNDSVHIKESRTFFKQRISALYLTIILSIIIILALLFFIGWSALLHYFVKHGILQSKFTFNVLMTFKWIIIIFLFYIIISFLYYYAPAKRERFKFISPGASLATFLFLLTSLGFNYYISHFSSYNKIYGSIGVLIIILMWIYINAIVMLLGFELNASITSIKRAGKVIGENVRN